MMLVLNYPDLILDKIGFRVIIKTELREKPKKEIEMPSLKVVNDSGREFDVRIVKVGDAYGLNDCLVNDCLVNDYDEPMVEFYDLKNSPEGYFVSSYLVSTLVEDRDSRYGLSLDGASDEWSLNADNMNDVVEFVKGLNL